MLIAVRPIAAGNAAKGAQSDHGAIEHAHFHAVPLPAGDHGSEILGLRPQAAPQPAPREAGSGLGIGRS